MFSNTKKKTMDVLVTFKGADKTSCNLKEPNQLLRFQKKN